MPADRVKNGQAFSKPVTRRVGAIVEGMPRSGPYVFPSWKRPEVPVYDLRKALAKIEDRTGVKVTVHDLRRTYTQAAERAGVGREMLKRLVGPSIAGDVTDKHYLGQLDDLKVGAAQKVEDVLCR